MVRFLRRVRHLVLLHSIQIYPMTRPGSSVSLREHLSRGGVSRFHWPLTPPSSDVVNNERGCTSTAPMCLYGMNRGADKSLARPGREQATPTKLQLLQANKKKKFEMLSVQPGLRRCYELHVGRKMATFQLLFLSGRAKNLSAPLYKGSWNCTFTVTWRLSTNHAQCHFVQSLPFCSPKHAVSLWQGWGKLSGGWRLRKQKGPSAGLVMTGRCTSKNTKSVPHSAAVNEVCTPRKVKLKQALKKTETSLSLFFCFLLLCSRRELQLPAH